MLEQLQTGQSIAATALGKHAGAGKAKGGVFANLFAALALKTGSHGKSAGKHHIPAQALLMAGKTDKTAAMHKSGVVTHQQKTNKTLVLQPSGLQDAEGRKRTETFAAAAPHSMAFLGETIKNDKNSEEKNPDQTDIPASILNPAANINDDTKKVGKAMTRRRPPQASVANMNKPEAFGHGDKAQTPSEMNRAISQTAAQNQTTRTPEDSATTKTATDEISINRMAIHAPADALANQTAGGHQATDAVEAAIAATQRRAGASANEALARNDQAAASGQNTMTALPDSAHPGTDKSVAGHAPAQVKAAPDDASQAAGAQQPAQAVQTNPAARNAHHAAQINLLMQHDAQFAQNHSGNDTSGRDGGEQSAAHAARPAADAASHDSRFSSLLQHDVRGMQTAQSGEPNILRAAHPMRAIEAMQHIAHSAKNGATRIELQLEPAHLGKVHVSLQTDAAKQLQLHLTVEHAVSRQTIEQHLPQLRAALADQGLSLADFSMHTGSQHQQRNPAPMQGDAHLTDGREDTDFTSAHPTAAAHGAQTSASGRLSIRV